MTEQKKKIYKFTMPVFLQLQEGPITLKRTFINKKSGTVKKAGDIVMPKKYYLNLNEYIKWYRTTRNDLKQLYTQIVAKQLVGIKMNTPIKLTFIHYRGDKKKSDRANVCSVHEKFFCDALTRSGCIPDDNDMYILETRYLSGGIDRGNARVEIIVEEI